MHVPQTRIIRVGVCWQHIRSTFTVTRVSPRLGPTQAVRWVRTTKGIFACWLLIFIYLGAPGLNCGMWDL